MSPLRCLLLAGLAACSPAEPLPARLGAFPEDLPALTEMCDAETVSELRTLCDQELAVRLAEASDSEAAGARCAQATDPMWAAECHFLVAETLAMAGDLDTALAACRKAPTFLVSCVEHVAMLQSVPERPGTTAADVQRFADQADAIATRQLAGLPPHQSTPLRAWLRLGRVQAWLLGSGRPPAGLGLGHDAAAAIERTVLAQEAARGMGPGAPHATVRAAYTGTGTWPATTSPLTGCIALAEPVDAALGPRTPVWGNTWRRVGQTPEEDAAIAILVAMFWAGTTDLGHLQQAVRRDRRPAVAWTALHLARHLVVEADDNDLRDLLADASRHPDPGVRAYAQRPLPKVHPLPRRCVGQVPGREPAP